MIFNIFSHKLATEPVKMNGSQRSRLINMRLAREKKEKDCMGREFLDRVRAFEHLHGRAFRRKAMQYWFQPDSDTYNCLFENVFTNTLSHLDALSAAGYDSLLEAEDRWNETVEKSVETFSGGYWLGSGRPQPAAIAGDSPRSYLAIERKD